MIRISQFGFSLGKIWETYSPCECFAFFNDTIPQIFVNFHRGLSTLVRTASNLFRYHSLYRQFSKLDRYTSNHRVNDMIISKFFPVSIQFLMAPALNSLTVFECKPRNNFTAVLHLFLSTTGSGRQKRDREREKPSDQIDGIVLGNCQSPS